MQFFKLNTTVLQVLYFLAGLFAGGLVVVYTANALATNAVQKEALPVIWFVISIAALLSAVVLRTFGRMINWLSTAKSVNRISIVILILLIFNTILLSSNSPSYSLFLLFFLPIVVFSTQILVETLKTVLSDHFQRFLFLNIELGNFIGILISPLLLQYISNQANTNLYAVFIPLGLFLLFFLCFWLLRIFIPELSDSYLNIMQSRAHATFPKLLKNIYTRYLLVYSYLNSTFATSLIAIAFIFAYKLNAQLADILLFVGMLVFISYFIGFILLRIFSSQISKNLGRKDILNYSLTLVVPFFFIAMLIYRRSLALPLGTSISSSFFVFGFFALLILFILKIIYIDATFKRYFSVVDIQYRFTVEMKTRLGLTFLSILTAMVVSILLYNNYIWLSILFVLANVAAIVWITFRMNDYFTQMLNKLLNVSKDNDDLNKYAYFLVFAILKNETKFPQRALNLLEKLHPVLFRLKLANFCASENSEIQRIALNYALKYKVLSVIPVLNQMIESKAFFILSNATLILQIHSELSRIEKRTSDANYIQHLAHSTLDDERLTAAQLSDYCSVEIRKKILNHLITDSCEPVAQTAIVSAYNVVDADLQRVVLKKLGMSDFIFAAFSSIVQSIGFSMYELGEMFYRNAGKTAIQTLLVRAGGEINTQAAHQFLYYLYDYIFNEVARQAIYIAYLKDITIPEDRKKVFETQLSEKCQQYIFMLSCLKAVKSTKNEHSETLIEAIVEEFAEIENDIYTLLGGMFNATRIEKVRKYQLDEQGEILNLSKELLAAIIPDELSIKPLVLTLLTKMDAGFKLKKSNTFFKAKEFTFDESFQFILSAESPCGFWTKAAALEVIRCTEDFNFDHNIVVKNINGSQGVVNQSALYLIDYKWHHLYDFTCKQLNISLNWQKDWKQYQACLFLKNQCSVFSGISAEMLLKLFTVASVKYPEKGKEYPIAELGSFVVWKGRAFLKDESRGETLLKIGDFVTIYDYAQDENPILYSDNFAEAAVLLFFEQKKLEHLLFEVPELLKRIVFQPVDTKN